MAAAAWKPSIDALEFRQSERKREKERGRETRSRINGSRGVQAATIVAANSELQNANRRELALTLHRREKIAARGDPESGSPC